MESEFNLEFTTTHFQFYIADKASPKDTGDFWTDVDAHESRLALEDGIVGVGTGCYGPVKATLIVQNQQSSITNFDGFDHVVEANLLVGSGVVQVLNCPDSEIELEIKVQPDIYRVRIYSANLSSVDGDAGDDWYLIEFWPDKHPYEQKERRVLKQYLV